MIQPEKDLKKSSDQKPDQNQSPKMIYTELAVRSFYSFLQAASSPKNLVEKAFYEGYAGLFLSDLNGFYGIPKAYQAWKDLKEWKEEKEILNFHIGIGVEVIDSEHSYILLPKNLEGYQRVCFYLTQVHQYHDFWKNPILPKSFNSIFYPLKECIIITLPPWDLKTILNLKESDHSIYLGVYRHLNRFDFQHIQEAFFLEKNYDLKPVVTQRVLYATKEDAKRLPILEAIRQNRALDEIPIPLNHEAYLKPLSVIYHLWKQNPTWLERNQEITQQITFQISDIRYQYPKPHLKYGEKAIDKIKEICIKNVPQRLGQKAWEKHRVQWEKEIQLIEELGFESYFLTLYEITQYAKSQGILYQGRGSAANSIVCYLMELTAVHPDQIEMLFERFLSHERQEPPDIDIDFDAERREEVIQWVRKKYHSHRSAQVCNIITFQGRRAIRSVAKVLKIPEEKIAFLQRYLRGRSWEVNQDLLDFLKMDEELLKKWVDLSSLLLDVPHHIGLHASGFVLSEEPIYQWVPIEKATMPGRDCIQWSKDDLETLGLLKIDLLGLGMMAALRRSFDLLKQYKGISYGLYNIPPNDPKTYELIQKADTVGVFQIESRAQMSMLPKVRPQNWYDLTIQIAIVRPGPIEGGLVHPFLAQRKIGKKPKYPIPELAPILDRTWGVAIFQEQIMKLMMVAANFTAAQADQIRRLLGQTHKDPEKMKDLQDRIRKGMKKKGLPETFITQILKTIRGFSSYGFPESHAASFAHLAYASCYLKAHHPEVFTCALLNSYPMGFYSPQTLIQDAKKRGVRFLPLSLFHSQWEFTLESINHNQLRIKCHPATEKSLNEKSILWGIREGFRLSKGFGFKLWEKIKIWREKSSKPKTLEESFYSLETIGNLSDWEIRLCIRLNLWGEWEPSLQKVMWIYSRWKKNQNLPLFAHLPVKIPSLPPTNRSHHTWVLSYQIKTYDTQIHPTAWFKKHFAPKDLLKQIVTFANFKFLSDQSQIWCLGQLSIHQRPPTAKGVSFLTLEDETGLGNLILWPDIYDRYRMILAPMAFFLVFGTLQSQDGVSHLIVSWIKKLDLGPFHIK